MLVTKIENGTVIDKIPPGKSIQILRILNIDEDALDTLRGKCNSIFPIIGEINPSYILPTTTCSMFSF